MAWASQTVTGRSMINLDRIDLSVPMKGDDASACFVLFGLTPHSSSTFTSHSRSARPLLSRSRRP